jgi:hypothetical protein
LEGLSSRALLQHEQQQQQPEPELRHATLASPVRGAALQLPAGQGVAGGTQGGGATAGSAAVREDAVLLGGSSIRDEQPSSLQQRAGTGCACCLQ